MEIFIWPPPPFSLLRQTGTSLERHPPDKHDPKEVEDAFERQNRIPNVSPFTRILLSATARCFLQLTNDGQRGYARQHLAASPPP